MTDEQLENLKKHIDSEIRFLSREPIVHNKEAVWVMECARVLGGRFAFVSRSDYSICFSGEAIYELQWAIGEFLKNKNSRYDVDDIFRKAKEEWSNARLKCEAIIQMFENRSKEERKALEERLQLEADYRYNNNRRY